MKRVSRFAVLPVVCAAGLSAVRVSATPCSYPLPTQTTDKRLLYWSAADTPFPEDLPALVVPNGRMDRLPFDGYVMVLGDRTGPNSYTDVFGISPWDQSRFGQDKQTLAAVNWTQIRPLDKFLRLDVSLGGSNLEKTRDRDLGDRWGARDQCTRGLRSSAPESGAA